MKKRLVGGLVLALAVISLLGGCGGKATTSRKATTGRAATGGKASTQGNRLSLPS